MAMEAVHSSGSLAALATRKAVAAVRLRQQSPQARVSGLMDLLLWCYSSISESFWKRSPTMANLTLKQVPDALYQRLKERAAAHRRSINNEAIVCLEQLLEPQRVDPRSRLEDIRALRREAPKVFLTDEALRQARDEGRP